MPTHAPPTLTPRQREVLAAIRRLTDRAGFPPTIREIGDAVGLASASSVHAHVRVLERAGLVSPAAGRPRARLVLREVTSEHHGLML